MATLSKDQRAALNKAFKGQGDTGTKAGPGRAAMRALLRDAVEAGLSDEEVTSLLNPAFYRGIADPWGGGQLVEDLDPRTLHNLAKYAATREGTGLGDHESATQVQSDFFDAFEDMRQKYTELANEG